MRSGNKPRMIKDETMSNTATVITTKAGEALIAQMQAENKVLVIDKFIFANVPNRPAFPNRDDVVPVEHVVHESAVHEQGRLTENSVIYSTTLASNVGPFSFNWSGLFCSEHNVLVAINFPPPVDKTVDAPGITGNTLVRSFVLEYKGISETTNITVDPSCWQYDAHKRMSKMDNDTAQAIIDQNGKDWFIDDGFIVTPQSSAYSIKAGAGYVSGHRISLDFDRILQVPEKPAFIYVDAFREGSPTGEWQTKFTFVVAVDEKDDYTDAQGVNHFVCKIAQVFEDGSVGDMRKLSENKQIITALKNVKYDGAIGNGLIDDAWAFVKHNNLRGRVDICAGKYFINQDIELFGDISISFGGVIAIGDGIILTINGAINAGDHQVFDTTLGGRIVFKTAMQINPSWFDHSVIGKTQTIRGFNAALKAVGNPSFNYNFIDGYRSAESADSAVDSVCIGPFAGAATTELGYVTAVGYSACRGKEVELNTGIFRPWIGAHLSAFGMGTLTDITSAYYVDASGSKAMNKAEVVIDVSCHGAWSLQNGTTYQYIVTNGSRAGFNYGTEGLISDNQHCVFDGYKAGYALKKGSSNTLLGSRAGQYSSYLESCTFVGANTGVPEGQGVINNSECYGNNAQTSASNNITLGGEQVNSIEGLMLLGKPLTKTAQARGIYNNTTANPANITVSSSGLLQRSTSSLKYKEVLEPVSFEWAKKTLEFEPILYKPTEGALSDKWSYYGYGAEQVEIIDPRYVAYSKKHMGYNADGQDILSDDLEANGVMYERIVVAHGVLLSKILNDIAELKKIKC